MKVSLCKPPNKIYRLRCDVEGVRPGNLVEIWMFLGTDREYFTMGVVREVTKGLWDPAHTISYVERNKNWPEL